MDKGEIAARLKKIRKEKSLTQRNLVDNFDFSEVQISNIECKKSVPRTKTFINMANSLDVPLSRIVDKSYDVNNKKLADYERWFGDLSSLRTLLLLKILEAIKEKLREYNIEKSSKEHMMAEEIDYGSVGKSIVKLREGKHLDQHTMSKRMEKRAGMKEGTYRNIESNNGTASMSSYMKIADELDVSVDYIFDKSLRNKEAVSREYIRQIFDNIDEKEKAMLKRIAEAIREIFDIYYI